MKPLVTLAIAFSASMLTACAQNVSFPDINTSLVSPNQNDRVQSIVFHYTAETQDRTLELFQDSKAQVSSHFVVSEDNIYQMVDLDKRAWHAGVSYWDGRHGLNDTSIGIEIVQTIQCNPSYSECDYQDFSPKLIANLLLVLEKLKQTYPNIKARNYLGHQDIAPSRKQDPGPRFPWQYLATQGYGAWYDSSDYLTMLDKLKSKPLDEASFYQDLTDYGYPMITDKNKEDVVRAFQTHFTPSVVTGKVTPQAVAALLALKKKYSF